MILYGDIYYRFGCQSVAYCCFKGKGCLFADTLTKIYHRIVILLGFGMGVVYQLVIYRFFGIGNI